MRRITTTVLTLGLAVAALTGCAVSITDDQDAAGPLASPTDASSVEVATDDPRPEVIAPPAPAASAAPEAPSNLRTRDEAIALADTTIACTPGLVIADDGKVVRVEGACDDVTVSGFATAVVLDDVSTLTVSGSGIVVYAQQVGDLVVSGDVNTILWRGNAPRLDDTGVATTSTRDTR
ncbi:uncharacterized protein conserved in bacteria [Microbacterium testaceum StLB037]|uniref:Uncharacterized protein conserved in bacteria n=1 Tax=Microbacterium testaceum (strain StLB037) TaxID=979556 RepID=E8NEC0_MICTS|nr:DUF3060 domain-containing protein [Microbacterium testaceum]BAJ73786.1 uncharacterized protein conserved in bacteria [Microbacterium testaceum StLB037]